MSGGVGLQPKAKEKRQHLENLTKSSFDQETQNVSV